MRGSTMVLKNIKTSSDGLLEFSEIMCYNKLSYFGL